MAITITFRTTDGTRWGVGSGEDPGGLMSPSQVDLNFWNLKQAIELVQSSIPAASVGIIDFTLEGDQLYANMTDGTINGPYTIPTYEWRFLGDWQPSTPYQKGDVVTNGVIVYFVLMNHTSEATFSAGANDGAGHAYYDVMIDVSAASLPLGGTTDQVLAKRSDTDRDAAWVDAQRTSVPGMGILNGMGIGTIFSSGGTSKNSVPLSIVDRLDEVIYFPLGGGFPVDITNEWDIIANETVSNFARGSTITTDGQILFRWTHFLS